MALLKGFPPSNTISPGIRLPMCCRCNTVHDWVNVAELPDGKYICHSCYTLKDLIAPDQADDCIVVQN